MSYNRKKSKLEFSNITFDYFSGLNRREINFYEIKSWDTRARLLSFNILLFAEYFIFKSIIDFNEYEICYHSE